MVNFLYAICTCLLTLYKWTESFMFKFDTFIVFFQKSEEILEYLSKNLLCYENICLDM